MQFDQYAVRHVAVDQTFAHLRARHGRWSMRAQRRAIAVAPSSMSMRRRHYKTRREHAPGSGGRAVWAEAGGRSESIWKQREYGFDLKTKGYTITSPGTLWAFNTRLSSAAERPCSVRSHADAEVVT